MKVLILLLKLYHGKPRIIWERQIAFRHDCSSSHFEEVWDGLSILSCLIKGKSMGIKYIHIYLYACEWQICLWLSTYDSCSLFLFKQNIWRCQVAFIHWGDWVNISRLLEKALHSILLWKQTVWLLHPQPEMSHQQIIVSGGEFQAGVWGGGKTGNPFIMAPWLLWWLWLKRILCSLSRFSKHLGTFGDSR